MQQMNIDILPNQTLLGLIDYFLVYSIKMTMLKKIKTRRYYLPKGQKELLKIKTLSSMEKTFMANQLILK